MFTTMTFVVVARFWIVNEVNVGSVLKPVPDTISDMCPIAVTIKIDTIAITLTIDKHDLGDLGQITCQSMMQG